MKILIAFMASCWTLNFIALVMYYFKNKSFFSLGEQSGHGNHNLDSSSVLNARLCINANRLMLTGLLACVLCSFYFIADFLDTFIDPTLRYVLSISSFIISQIIFVYALKNKLNPVVVFLILLDANVKIFILAFLRENTIAIVFLAYFLIQILAISRFSDAFKTNSKTLFFCIFIMAYIALSYAINLITGSSMFEMKLYNAPNILLSFVFGSYFFFGGILSVLFCFKTAQLSKFK